MAALLLSDGRVQRPFNWIFSLSTGNFGSGDDPVLVVVNWASQANYQADNDAGNMDSGSFVSVDVPGFAPSSYDDTATILLALTALGGDYAGAGQIA